MHQVETYKRRIILSKDQLKPEQCSSYSTFLSDNVEGSLVLELKDTNLLFSWSILKLEQALHEMNSPLASSPRSCSPRYHKVINTLVEEQNIPEAKIGLACGVSAFLYLYTSIHG